MKTNLRSPNLGILHLECFAGISGDMFLGALLDLGLPLKALNGDLAGLGIRGLSVRRKPVERAGIRATQAHVIAPHAHSHRNLADIKRIIGKSRLAPAIRQKAVAVFARLAEAEARIHGQAVSEVHFHEVGALDAIADIVGVCSGLARLGITRVVVSAVNTGSGTVACAHGLLPVPAPATLALLAGFKLVAQGPTAELATPTGAALLAEWAEPEPEGFIRIPQRIGYGAGSRSWPDFPNVVRATLCTGSVPGENRETDTVAVLTTWVDDASPQVMAYALEQLLAAGALDASLQPIYMKKNRPGQKLEAICHPAQAETMAELIFREVPTLGIRLSIQQRFLLTRSQAAIQLHGYSLRFKQAFQRGRNLNLAPEYEDARTIALKTGLPLRQVLDEARETIRRKHDRRK